MGLFSSDPAKASARAAEKTLKKQKRAEAARLRKEKAAAHAAWLHKHPAEKALNSAAGLLRGWPQSNRGISTTGHPVKGGKAEFMNMDAHKAWTATRLISGAATLGVTTLAAGRKNKGMAVINIVYGDGFVETHQVKPEPQHMMDAPKYVTAFNALAEQLAQEDPADA
ncbi:hypothetical protein ABZ921_09670 [Streptomyces atriruber]|uniref:HK97 gp10 family phage protein n=1 Tax=Streptomyces atriruber TaxID=545121 RepID=A0ABV3BIS5_9ACTN